MNVREGFSSVELFRGSDWNKCLSIKVICGGIEIRALIDTGCLVNVVYMEAYERMILEDEQKGTVTGQLKGIGNILVPVVSSFRECIMIGNLKMEESDFYVLQSKSDKYDMLLGYNFLKENRIVIHPEHMMLEKKVSQDGRCQMYVNEAGNVKVNKVKGIEVFALESTPLEADKVVRVKVGWSMNAGIVSDRNKMFMVDGYDARYRVKRVAHVFDGILDLNDPRVCVQVKPDIIRKRIRGIHVGDILGRLYTVLNMEDEKIENDLCVNVGNIQKSDWVYDELIGKVKLNAELGELRRQKIYRMLWERRMALSQGDDDFGFITHSSLELRFWSDILTYKRILGVSAEKPELDWIYIPAE
ncbi:hypothetical protein Avbf_04774 [Armadillidium vulgare]|nr:hypothetical protein Avbf_04774 [Armadillidium vulgare]